MKLVRINAASISLAFFTSKSIESKYNDLSYIQSECVHVQPLEILFLSCSILVTRELSLCLENSLNPLGPYIGLSLT